MTLLKSLLFGLILLVASVILLFWAEGRAPVIGGLIRGGASLIAAVLTLLAVGMAMLGRKKVPATA